MRHDTSRSRAIVALLGLVGVVVLFAATPALAGPPTPPPTQASPGTIDLEAVLAGSGEVRGRARTDLMSPRLDVVLVVENGSGAPVDLLIEPGTLLASDQAGEQTTVLSEPVERPDYVSAPAGDDYTVTLPPGQTRVELIGYCAEELDAGPSGELHYAGMAAEPLPQVMRNIAASEADSDTAQEAVWWVTDDPAVPVGNRGVERLLDGVDTAAFAADPHRVGVDATYTPIWDGGDDYAAGPGLPTPFGPSNEGGGASAWLWVVALAVVGGLVLLLVRLGGRSTGSAPAAPVQGWGQGWAAGWYPDPWGSERHRWWDGRGWTDHTSDG